MHDKTFKAENFSLQPLILITLNKIACEFQSVSKFDAISAFHQFAHVKTLILHESFTASIAVTTASL